MCFLSPFRKRRARKHDRQYGMGQRLVLVLFITSSDAHRIMFTRIEHARIEWNTRLLDALPFSIAPSSAVAFLTRLLPRVPLLFSSGERDRNRAPSAKSGTIGHYPKRTSRLTCDRRHV